MNGKLLEIVACPSCHGRLEYDEQHQRLICRFEKISYPIKKGIPVLLAEQAQPLNQEQDN
ncbi:Trm112 family protein [Aggregatibacter actinomycetemcomitans]|uniref:Trm112 family protein n=1 Tax=Aggregatibacter actinomycetemcomitans TaxID=714 RepID=UPI00197BF2E4|nr:Trm112 family protein [Aggregatibacter actinomycetemcomitans]MBN6064464.1 Trm112 family protein [Aggregatibacter actinomycetemcomitans]MBN6081804.1 Trm112 family protein [Aggregatibacter actinomycetemcomitans]MBN6084403.1 Trm112 family protein [Aggregatibacter actinomycetemcomitans]